MSVFRNAILVWLFYKLLGHNLYAKLGISPFSQICMSRLRSNILVPFRYLMMMHW
ncbi:hypothetical protein M758_8G007000 [Ceratodon purpureus]|uniref:Uncharacterized protein n=1 Tax=Ceratodon purpureus TaxID=3225 RepID=A0A8T0GTY9_CERPU|nr:hypothetical protein KC19_8G007700 [Ceratodon purpureus]KAG0607169.1 hypothetical protein M758_8G007000 [Ceratodon purpureus]